MLKTEKPEYIFLILSHNIMHVKMNIFLPLSVLIVTLSDISPRNMQSFIIIYFFISHSMSIMLIVYILCLVLENLAYIFI